MRRLTFGSRTRNLLWTGVFSVILLGGMVGYGFVCFGSVGALVAVVKGRTLYLEPAVAFVGDLKPREHVAILVRIQNLASVQIKLLGSHSGCGCVVAKGLPVNLAPGEVREFEILITAPGSPGEFTSNVTFYANVAGEEPSVLLQGRVLETQAENMNPNKVVDFPL